MNTNEPFIPLHLKRRDGIKQSIILNTEDTINNYKNKISQLEDRILSLLDENSKLRDTISELNTAVQRTEIKTVNEPISSSENTAVQRTEKKPPLTRTDFLERKKLRSQTLSKQSTLEAIKKLQIVRRRIKQATLEEKMNQLDVEDKMRLEKEMERQAEEED